MNKKGLEFKLLTYAIVAFSVIIIASGVVVNEWANAYNLNVSNDLGDLNKLSSVSDQAGVSKDKLTPEDIQSGETAETTTFSGVYGVIGTIFSSYTFVYGENGVIGSIVERFGLPVYVYQMIVVLIVVAMIWALVSIIFRLWGRTA